MGSTFKAFCKKCAHVWSQETGDGFTFVRYLCGKCGNNSLRPRCAKNNQPSMSRSMLRDYFEAHDGDWVASGRDFDENELRTISEMFSYCGCGGTFYPDDHKRARVRCPDCLSADIAFGPVESDFD
jgi:hypothetical protein